MKTHLQNPVSKLSFESLSENLFKQPIIPLIDGRDAIWYPKSKDTSALFNYTFGRQVVEPYDYTAAIRTSAHEFMPDVFIILGLRPGAIRVQLDTPLLAKWLDCLPGHINASGLTIETPFQMRRRGVELKLHLGDPTPQIDETLVQNIVKGRRWLAMVIDGKSFSELAQVENVSTRRVQDIANLALIAPDILDAITLGEKPNGLSTDYLIKTRFSAIWSEQRAQFSAL